MKQFDWIDLLSLAGAVGLCAGYFMNLSPAVLIFSAAALLALVTGLNHSRRARADETGVAIKIHDDSAKVVGQITVVGFDNGVYYLEETKNPLGYEKLLGRKEFTIADGSLTAIYNNVGGQDIYSTGSGVHVVNRKGDMLPETGGMGTVLFVTFGMLTVLGTGVLLVTKKRMAMIED